MPHARTDQATPSASPANFSLRHSERNLIVKALEQTGGNKTKAATLLGISRDVLRYRMRKLKLIDGR
jgi:DNA-binding NtrC family response regulator